MAGVDLNFCRNPACAFYGVLPDPFKRPNGSPSAPLGVPRGAVPGGTHKEFYKCPACRTTSRVKNNRAAAEEHERLREPDLDRLPAPCTHLDEERVRRPSRSPCEGCGLPQVEEYGLPATGSMLRYDVIQFAHAMRLRDHIGHTDAPLIFVMDGDAGLKQSFATVFQPEVSAGRAHLAIIDFDKAMTNDMRNCVVADGRTDLCATTGLTPTELRLIPAEFRMYSKRISGRTASFGWR